MELFTTITTFLNRHLHCLQHLTRFLHRSVQLLVAKKREKRSKCLKLKWGRFSFTSFLRAPTISPSRSASLEYVPREATEAICAVSAVTRVLLCGCQRCRFAKLKVGVVIQKDVFYLLVIVCMSNKQIVE